MKKLFVLGMSSMFALSATAQTLEERVEALEFASYEDIFRFSGSLEMEYSSITSKDNDADEETSGQSWKNWLKLDMAANATKQLTFFGRLSAAKLSNRMSAYTDGSFGDIDGQLEEGQSLKNSEVYLERAFVNYAATDKLSFTFGRLPTANGTPYHLTRNESSGGAYPFLSYNAVFDGMALSYQVTPELSAKFIYTPFQFVMGTDTSGNENTTSSGDTVDTPTDTWSVMFDYEKQNLSWARRMNLVLHYIKVNKITLDINDTNGSGTSTGQTDFNFDIARTVLALELNGISGSNFDLGLQLMSMTHKTNEAWTTADGAGGTTDYYFLSDDGEEKTAQISVLTLRYGINQSNKVGIQYTQASQDAFASDLVSKTPISFYGVAGSGYHLFYNKAFNGGLNMNVGVYQVQRDYDAPVGGIFGERDDADQEDQAVYTSFVANF